MWVQTKLFNKNEGGTIPGMCLKNVRKGYGIPARYLTAAKAWANTEQHTDRNIPLGVDVPLFYSWKTDGHINVRLADGTVWNDGKIYQSLADFEARAPITPKPKYLGWGESINNETIIKEEDMAKLTKQHEIECLRLITGNPNSMPGKDYNYKFTGLEATEQNISAMHSWWFTQWSANAPHNDDFVEVGTNSGLYEKKG